MRKLYATLFAAGSLFFSGILNSQTTVQIGMGADIPANTLYSPVYRFSATSTTTGSRSNILFTQAELATAGILPGVTITSVEFNKVNSANFVTPATYTMYMGNTTNTILPTTTTWASILSSHTQVFTSNSFNMPLAPGWVVWNVTPFVYTGGSLEIATECAMVGNGGATDMFQWQYTASIPTDLIVGVASATGATLNGTVAAYKHRPNIKITFTSSSGCTTPPTAGVSTASPATPVCAGASIQLGLTGNSGGSGQTYVWQSSPTSGGTYTDISSSSPSSSHTITASITTWYRAAVTCSGNTQYSAPVQVVVNPAFPGGTYTINSGAATGGTNFQTFSDAIAALSCGIAGPVIFNVQAGSGPYNEQVTIPAISGSSAINTITFNGNGATIQATPVTATRHIIKLDGADYITFNNLRVVAQAGSTFGWGIHLANGADGNTINSCTIDISAVTSTTQSNSACIVGTNSTTSVTAAGDASNNTISNNTITGAYQGIIINGTATGTLAVNNTITNNTIHDFYANGIELTQNDGSVISYNNIHRTNRVAVTTFAGVELGAGNRNVTVNANRIHDTHTAASTQTGTAYGVYANACDAPSGSENRVINNLIYKFNSGSGTIYGLYNSASDGFYYYHNTVVLDNASSSAGITRGFYQTTTAANLQVKNNIIHIARGGTGIKYCLYFGTTTSSIVSNKNVLYNNATAGTNGIGSFGTTGYTTLANWQTANGGIYDQQSVSTDPLYVNPAAGDYTPGAVAINNIGDNVGVTTDILNNARSAATPDPGAYEFGVVPPCVNPPTAGTVTVTPDPVCIGANFTLAIVGGTTGTGQTYQWQSSPDNSVWTDIPGATNISLITTQTTNTHYRVIVTCGTGNATSASLLVAALPCYCTSIPTNIADTEIFGVSLNGAGNNSDCVTPAPGPGSILSRYSNFYTLGALTSVFPGTTVPFTVTVDDCTPAGYFGAGAAIWIDFNRDGDFLDAGEKVYVEDAEVLAPRTITGTIAIPIGATPGITGMRVIVAEDNVGNDLQPCMTYSWGETEDYLIEIISPVPCTGTPTGGTAVTSKSVVCLGENFNLSATGATLALGITYQWQSSSDNINWINISGANQLSFTTSQTATTHYRLVVTCSNTGNSSNSTSVLVTSPSLVSGTFTINNALPTGGTNFNSFNDAYNYIKCGINGPVIFNVDAASGPYTEQLIINQVPGASAVNTITFNGNGRIIRFTSTNSAERAVIKLNGADHFIFDSLTINATANTASDYGFGIQLLNNADSNIVRSSTINITKEQTSTNHVGISISASATSATGTGNTLCDNNLFEDNIINGGYYGITNYGSSTVANQRNKFLRNTIKDFYLYGIATNGTFQTLIDGNDISRPTRTVLSTGTSAGVYFTGLSTSAKVNGNYIHDMLGGNTTLANDVYGIYFTAVDALSGLDNIVTNNVIYNIRSNGLIYGLYNAGSDNVLYYHNTVSLDDNASTTTDVTRGFYQTTSASGIILRNNIFTLRRGGTGLIHGIYFNTPASSIISNNNDVFFNPGANVFYGYNGTDQALLIDWQVATGQDANSFFNDPFYENAPAGNLKPTNAVIDNVGAPLGITTDVLGAPRSPTSPDIGAYEYVSPPCTTPPTPGTATVSASPVCENTFVALGVTGFSIGSGQTYQWQSAIAIAGPYNNISSPSNSPSFTISASETLYYRLAITCGGNTQYSAPVLLTVNPGLPGGTYTIDPTQPASPTNFITFNAAKDAMACGITGPVVFNVEPGTGPYLEQLLLDSIPGTSNINTITFNGAGNIIRFSSSATAERAVIRLSGTDHTTFNDLTIDAAGTGTYGWGVWLLNGADSNAFNNCNIITSTTSTSTTNFAGVVITGSTTTPNSATASNCDGNIFDGNIITGGYYGMTMMSSAAAPIRNNKFINNQVRDFYSYGIYVGNTIDGLVEKNVISRPTRTSITTHYGIYGGGTTNLNLRVSKNRITNPAGGATTSTSQLNGIYFVADGGAGQEAKVTNNIIDNFDGAGALYGLYNSSANNVHYYHNTVSFDNTTSTSTNLSRGFYQTGTAAGIIFKNNIISITRGGTGAKHAIYFGTTGSTIASNRNDLYVNPASGTSGVGFFSTNQVTLANWQTASSQDANSQSVDPQFINISGGDFRPQQALIDDKGEPVGITTDYLNAARSLTTPDEGAIEFAVIPCTVPPVAGTSTVAPSSGICLGNFVTLNLSGNSTGGFQKYIWQYGPSATGPWQDISDTLYSPQFLYELSSYVNTYFRAIVICGTGTSFSVPVQVSINPALLAGDYTIDPAIPASATNFQSFASAVAAMQCGIAGSVRFHAVPGIYNEQIIIKKVPGASATSTVTFMSQNGNPASVTLTYNSTITALNYILKLDSASFITFKNISFTATNIANGRAIEFANNASKDSILNCMIDVPASSSTSNVVAGIFGTALSGTDIVIKGNTITDGSSNIYLSGIAGAANRFVLDSNILSGAYYYSSYTGGINNVRVTKNTVTRSGILNTTAYGVYLTNCDSIYVVDDNKVTIENAGTTNYGIYLTGCAASPLRPGSVSRNKITAVNNITSATLYGLYQTNSISNYTVNNVIDVNSTGATVRGLYSSTGGGIRYYNNTVRNSSPSTATTNVAAYFSQTSGTSGVTNIRNNVFYHAGGGVAVYQGNVANIYSDYNMYYTSGPVLILQGTVQHATLQAWRNAENWDYSSIVYAPALVTGTTLQPDVNNANVWAMHGRGVQITDNASDHNGNPRPTTLTSGVPDLGAYEFLPAVNPPALAGTPASPAANTTQYFMFGTDTVQKVTWGATVPTNVEVRRYSGVIPPNLAAGQQSMYFYTDVDITGSTPSGYTLKQFYIDPWMRNIPAEPTVKMGRTNATNNWIVSSASTVDVFNNVITESGLSFMDKFTGMTDGQAPAPPVPPGFTTDTSNRGRRFWVGYGHHYGFSTNGQTMVLYLSAEQAANVTVKVNGTGWVRNYAIPANTVRVSDPLPESGLIDSRILDEGLSNNGISIESDVPIVAYAHIYQGSNSGATMLLPVGTYGYEYRSLNATQYYPTGGAGSHSWFYVIADRDSTLVEITPSVTTKSGRPAGVPFQVYLMRGQVYNVMGTQPTAAGTDISGSTIKSIPNASGRCFPIAVFSGSSRTALCNTTNGDNFIQQAFPYSAWGTKYLTFATANSASNNLYYSNKWRVMVKDPATVVQRNGVTLNPATLVTPGNYYEIGITGGTGASTASYFEADQPIMVAQYMISSDGTSCPGLAAPGGDGDPEMIYISPIEQGIKRAVFYTTDQSAINSNYINVIVPTTGLSSLTIDGSSTFTDLFAHPYLAGYTCIRQNLGGTAGQHIIQCDSAFTAITYGLGSVESYGYNAGTLVKNLSATPAFNNVFNSGSTSTYTCKGTPFNLRIQISVKPTQLIWNLSQVPNISPNADVVQNNPVPADSVTENNKKFYIYTLPTNYSFSAVGNYLIPITVFHPSIEGCGGSIDITLPVSVIAAPVSDFTASAPNCIGEPVQFNATTTTSNGVPVNQWTWNFGDNSNGTGQNPIHTYATAGTFNVALRGIADDGCVGDTTKALVISAKPIPAIVQDTVYVCNNASAAFNVQNPIAGAIYNWYSAATAGTLLGTGNTLTVNNVTGFVNVYLEAVVGGCASVTRDRATAAILPTLATPTVIVDSIGVNMLRFRWNAIPNATGYQVTTNGGTTWLTPSSGPTGLTHTVSGLTLGATVTVQVRALGGCLPAVSTAVAGQTRTDQVYIPNSFTPNGDGRNDVLRVYSNVIRSMRIVIFNQWGEKVYESTDQNMAWDGTYRNKPQPSGVYIYVAEIIINTGEKLERKGAINLVR